MKDLIRQAPFDKHLSPLVPFVSQGRKKQLPRVEGISKFIKHLKSRGKKNELFIAGATAKEALKEAFCERFPIRDIKVFKRYAFVSVEENANIDDVPGKYHSIGGNLIYVDYAKGGDPKFIPNRLKNRINFWHNYKNKFK
ncbi:uncharacterized protein Eint_110290 [Encephalitozoon intestinalis ATCC 50506]|uniref:Uncharacterized protein n=1 Tax=Encephalitozoon intestinalis (strain ATCC 50506) TaxID=876142 RepID=E0SAA4_ENCIT|nr:uncharacterized protein Eint_110290 [Encephalitozoon intestinalis ATCC 50506]ADM12529.1 hypothetical protein Eint_110290 [Encephalitozoon intestinalis ATCC 50506]UTX46382.1 hypothetical protein GPK93_11g19890 [Encephalitozoon intestinalis]